MAASQGGQFTPAQAAEDGEQHQGAVSTVEGVSNTWRVVSTGRSGDRSFPGTFDPAWIPADQPVDLPRQEPAPIGRTGEEPSSITAG